MLAVDGGQDLIDGLGLALNHYGEWDAEGYKVGVLQALDAAEGRVTSFEEHEAAESQTVAETAAETSPEPAESIAEPANTADVEAVVLEVITANAGEDGIDYDTIMKHCAKKGLTDEASIEDAIDCLRDDKCEIMEPRFGWFKPM